MPVNFDKQPMRKNTNATKWDGLPQFFNVKTEDEVLPLWVADMDFDCPEPIVDALRQRIDHRIFGYTMVSNQFKTSVVSWMARRHQADINPEWVRFSPGVLKGLTNAILALSQQGDGVIIQTPVYYPFSTIIHDVKRQVIENPLIERDGFYKMDFEDLEAKCALPETKILILCNPHNPVARVYTQDELICLAQICAKHQVVVLADEIHADLIFKPYRHCSFMSLPDVFKHQALVFISPSKTFNLAGLQTSSVIIPNAQHRTAYDQAAAKTHTTSINVFGETAMVAAYDHCASEVDALMDYLTLNVDFVRTTIQSRFPQLRLFEPQGTYLLWIDFRNSGIDPKVLPDFMSHKARLAVDDGSWFGPQGSGFIRLNIACPKAMLEEAFDRLEAAFKSK
jgi:cystathionine beta-lyase